MKYVFFRNDDVRGTLDDSLVKITDVFIKNNVPICHAVEPANVSPEVIQWLLDIKSANPNLIEIVQHGYSHSLNYQKMVGSRIKKGEFGGNRSYLEQYEELKKGMKMMNDYFDNRWFPLLTFPYGARNQETIDACKDLAYLVVNGSMSPSLKHILFSWIGRKMNLEYLLGRKVSWNLNYRFPDRKLFQIDLTVSFIKKYFDELQSAEFSSLDELIIEFSNAWKFPNIGFLLHHRYHNEASKIDLVEDVIKYLKKNNQVQFVTQEQIYNEFK